MRAMSTKRKHKVRLNKEMDSKWWVAHTDVEGVTTQGHSVSHAMDMAKEALALWFNCEESEIEVEREQ
jgi:predicted RNase H-like HicB family nuclease